MAATDSYRLSVKETRSSGEGAELEAIVPARALTELARIAQGRRAVALGVHENHVVFGAGDMWLTTRRIDGQFPNYSQLAPGDLRARGQAAARGVPGRRTPRLGDGAAQLAAPASLRGGELTVSAQTQDVGEAKESLPVPFTGEPLEIGFNPEFLRDGLESVAGDEVRCG